MNKYLKIGIFVAIAVIVVSSFMYYWKKKQDEPLVDTSKGIVPPENTFSKKPVGVMDKPIFIENDREERGAMYGKPSYEDI